MAAASDTTAGTAEHTHGGRLEALMNLLDKIRALLGGGKTPQHTSEQQDADREDADRALEAMTRRR